MSKLAIIDYGAGNVQSVKYAFNRLGTQPLLTNNPEEIKAADKIIFPGVGHAQAAMENLKKNNLDRIIKELKQPVLGICLGMQLLCSYSEEGPATCLGIFNEGVVQFPPLEKVPHMGWNSIHHLKGKLFSGIKENDHFYFVHSFYVPESEQTTARCDYIVSFSAAIQKDNFYACQFHPEKSGDAGEQILKNFLEL